MSIGPNGPMGHFVHYEPLSPNGDRRHPHGYAQKVVSISFDNIKADGWVTIKQGHYQIDLGPEELRRLASLIINRCPLDVLSGVGEDDDGN